MNMRKDADQIIQEALRAAQPDAAVQRALEQLPPYSGKLILIAVGKAAWQMAKSAHNALGSRICDGIIITKYGHSKGPIGTLTICEAGHPIPDENTYAATQKAIELVQGCQSDDLILFLLSGGGSALFEKPSISPAEMGDITQQLLASGASITEMNTIRKRLSQVKGGKFAQLCAPAHVYSVILSDVLGDPLDMIASGPTYPDSTCCADALCVAERYAIHLSQDAMKALHTETPKTLDHTDCVITGSVRQLCFAAERAAKAMGYTPIVLTDCLCCEAREAGSFLSSIAQYYRGKGGSYAIIAGGETVVHLTGKGKGGRNQELALSAAKQLCGMRNVLLFSIGSDGTDGPTDAAGGIVDGQTAELLAAQNIEIDAVLRNNDAYHALQKVDGLLMTGPTGTNVNDFCCLLIRE